MFGTFGKNPPIQEKSYNETVMQAMKVEHEASRRLLQNINAFQEEVTIVNDVLKQQTKVLLGLKQALNPATFKTPSIARSLRYRYESEGIDTILLTIAEKLRNCSELRDRAQTLAHQNVQLVETLQDDNSKAIFIFTMYVHIRADSVLSTRSLSLGTCKERFYSLNTTPEFTVWIRNADLRYL